MPVCRADAAGIERAVAELRAGRPVVFPTDTVYGIGVATAFASGPQALFEAKGRPSEKPVAWLVGEREDLARYGKNLSEAAVRLAQAAWPGALTLVVDASDDVPEAFRGFDGSLGLRMPDAPFATALIKRLGCPVATTSANVSGLPATADPALLDPCFASAFLCCLTDTGTPDATGTSSTGVASTVVDCRGGRLEVLRQGDVGVS